MNRSTVKAARSVAAILMLAAAFHSEPVRAELPGAADDGWHTWRISAVDDAPEWCCYTAGNVESSGCHLDKRHSEFGSTNLKVGNVDQVQIYALLESGQATKIRTLSACCPVTTDAEVVDLGVIDVDVSIDWLQSYVDPRSDVASDALAAIAVHRGSRARELLVDVARSGDDQDNREEAIFWMAQVRIAETADELHRFMFRDDDPKIREYAAFSYAQSNAVDRAELLIRQGKEDPDAGVRGQAWFWLAQTGAVESEAEIRRAIVTDDDEDVREQAVFALSQLPEDRSVEALVATIENRDLDMDIREQALFWLAQTESDHALDYLDRLFSGR